MTEILARLQFALTIGFHYIYPPLSIGLGLFLVIMEGLYLKTGDLLYERITRFWIKIFALTFSLGVATGIVMEFEFGTNWATYSRYVGDIFGSALAAEGVFAFFLESGFLALLLFGWDRISKSWHFFSTVMVAVGAHFSAIWIVVANSWMQTPAGFQIENTESGPRAVVTNFWEMVFNPSSIERLTHTILGAWLAAFFLVISVNAYYLLKQRFILIAEKTLKIVLPLTLIVLILQAIVGDRSSVGVAKNQPSKFAALEGIYKTQKNAPIHLFGIPNNETEEIDFGLAIPGMLSFLVGGSTDTTIVGLDKYDIRDRPPVGMTFQFYHLMIMMWGFMLITTLWGLYLLRKNNLGRSSLSLKLLILSVLFPQIANQAGWFAAEIGRQPWIVQNLLRTSEALSKVVTANQILFSIILFGILYIFLFALFIFLLDKKIRMGPQEMGKEEHIDEYRNVMKQIEPEAP